MKEKSKKQAEEESIHDGFFPRGLSKKLAQTFFENIEYLVNYK